MPTESWSNWKDVSGDDVEVGLAYHGDSDPGGTTCWQSGSRHVLVFGIVPNRDELGYSTTELVDELFESPETTFSKLDGPFSLAGVDVDREILLLGTDKIGSRPLYYANAGIGTTDEEFAFCSHVGPLSELVDPELDPQALSDMLMLGSVWGERTLLAGVRGLRPGHFLQYEGGKTTVTRYWHPTCDTSETRFYGQRVFREYRNAVTNVTDTVTGDIGLWLSGGLDSRMMGTVLAEYGVFPTAFTYDRPLDYRKVVGYSDVDLAPKVAKRLSLDHETVAHPPSEVPEFLTRAVKLVDGMIAWPSLLGLAASFELPRSDLDVVFEGSGHSEFLGEGLWRYHLNPGNYSRPESAILARHGNLDPDEAETYLTADVNPVETLTEEVTRSEQDTFAATVTDVNVRNLFSRFQLLSNKVPRSLFGTRHPFASGDLLAVLCRLPADRSMATVPLTGGKIPWGYSPLKLDLARRLGPAMARLPYERTGIPPSMPNRLHGVGFVVQESVNRTLSEPPFHRWLREYPPFREWTVSRLEQSRRRPEWSTDAIDSVAADVLEGEGEFGTAAAIASVELWCDAYDL
nr:asparagine synthase-related protein [Halorussus sp. JP-T4]